MTPRPLISTTHCTARTQYRTGNGRDLYARTIIEFEPAVMVVTICGPGDLLCESRRITNPAVVAFIQWHLDTVDDLSRREGA